MNEIIATIVIATLGSTGLWTLINGIISTFFQKKSSINKAVLSLLHDRLYSLLNFYISKGEITADEYENIQYMIEPYKKLGGNGTCERLIKELDKIRLKTENGNV